MTNLRISCTFTALLIFALALVGPAHAQSTGTVTGRVVDAETNAPLPGVNITIQNSDMGASTNEAGQFRLTGVPDGQAVLRAHFVGYRTLDRSLTVEAGKAINVQLFLSPKTVEMRGIEVSARTPGTEPSAELPEQRIQEAEVADPGTLLRNVTGVNAARRGALGLDPNVRGLSETEVGVYVDGMRTFPAGPGRMDTPMSHVDPSAIKRIEVVKGPYALTTGPGNMSAIEVTQRGENPPPTLLTGIVRTGAKSNREALETTGFVMGRQGSVFYSANGAWRRGDDYTTGSGEAVPGGFTSGEGHGRIGIDFSDRSTLSVRGRYQEQNDIDYPGRMLHAEYFETGMGQIEYAYTRGTGALRSVNVRAGVQQTLHKMTNQGKPSYDMGMRITVPTEVQNYNGRAAADLALGNGWTATVGADVIHTYRDATRSRSMVDMNMENIEKAWPGVTLTQSGTFVKAEQTIGVLSLTGSARLDVARADASDPTDLFLETAGTDDLDRTHTMINGALTASLPLSQRWTLSLGAGSVTRPADASERYANRFPASKSQMSAEFQGDPSLDPERSTQADLWIDGQGSWWSLSVNGFARQIDDYITLQETELDPILPMSPAVYRYTNAEATFYGSEVNASVVPVQTLTLRASGSYLWGRDESVDEPAFGVSPPSANLGLRWRPSASAGRMTDLYLDGSVLLVAEQDRVSTTRGEEPTDGYTRVDLQVGAQFLKRLELTVGVENLFDVAYTNHLNSKNPFSGAQIPEPGRVFTTDLTVRF